MPDTPKQQLKVFSRAWFPKEVLREAISRFCDGLDKTPRFEGRIFHGCNYTEVDEEEFFQEYRSGVSGAFTLRHVPDLLSDELPSTLEVRIFGEQQTEILVRHSDSGFRQRVLRVFEDAEPNRTSARPLVPGYELHPRIFLAYGQDKRWKDVAAALSELKYEVIEFNSDALPGVSTYEQVEKMVYYSDFAVILMLAEIKLKHPQAKKVRVPRFNVLFELGFAMGVFGRHRVFMVTDPGQIKDHKLDQILSDTAALRRVHLTGGPSKAAEQIHHRIQDELHKLEGS